MLTALLCSSTGLLGVTNNFNGQSKPIAEGRHVTGYYRVEGLLRNLGKVNYDPGEKDKPYVVVDGKLITGRDPISAQLFGETVAKELKAGH
jgi:putative intracellular protease/amidase